MGSGCIAPTPLIPAHSSPMRESSTGPRFCGDEGGKYGLPASERPEYNPWRENGWRRKRISLLLSVLVLALAACSSWFQQGRNRQSQHLPSEVQAGNRRHSAQLISRRPDTRQRQWADQRAGAGAVNKEPRYAVCVRFTERDHQPRDRRQVHAHRLFLRRSAQSTGAGQGRPVRQRRLQAVPGGEQCCLGKACEERAKKKSGWSLF